MSLARFQSFSKTIAREIMESNMMEIAEMTKVFGSTQNFLEIIIEEMS